jgi:hypothetical protein
MNINTDRMDGYLRDNGGLTLKQALVFNYWSFFNFKKCEYFYLLCEDGYSNLIAFNKTTIESHEVINKRLAENKNT